MIADEGTSSSRLVSIGLPTYNRAASIRRAIESALGQDYTNIEIIISDNASTDETQQVCEEYRRRDNRIRYIRQADNIQSTPNFQAVLSNAQGEYFMWLADDDWLDKAYVSRCLQFLLAHSDYVLACGVAKYYRAGELLKHERPLSLQQESGAERVEAYFKELDENGAIYGLMRGRQVVLIPCQHTFGWDWLFVSTVAYTGKIKTLEDVSIHRSLSGSADSSIELAASYGWSKFRSENAFLFLALNIFREIAWRSSAYKSLGTSRRLRLAVVCEEIIRKRYYAVPFTDRLRSLLRLRARLRRIMLYFK